MAVEEVTRWMEEGRARVTRTVVGGMETPSSSYPLHRPRKAEVEAGGVEADEKTSITAVAVQGGEVAPMGSTTDYP